MKRNNELFNEIFKKIKYAGSFYKGTKVSKPDEYDLDLIVQLPLNYMSLQVCYYISMNLIIYSFNVNDCSNQFETDHEHYGYVKIKVEEKDKLFEWGKHR